MNTIKCDACGKEIEFDFVSTYANLTYIKKVKGFKTDNYRKEYKPVARQKDNGFGKYTVICFECDKKQGVK